MSEKIFTTISTYGVSAKRQAVERAFANAAEAILPVTFVSDPKKLTLAFHALTSLDIMARVPMSDDQVSEKITALPFEILYYPGVADWRVGLLARLALANVLDVTRPKFEDVHLEDHKTTNELSEFQHNLNVNGLGRNQVIRVKKGLVSLDPQMVETYFTPEKLESVSPKPLDELLVGLNRIAVLACLGK